MASRRYLIYDGICNLCVGSVRILKMLDKTGLIRFVPYQHVSPSTKKRYGLTRRMLQGRMHLVDDDDSISSGPLAIKQLCILLTPFNFLCNILATRPAERLYNWLAQRRYLIFGCRHSCFTVDAYRNSPFEP
ncbi:MAG TPA: DUF393 domain-containing protein [Candidatus Saccharimonadales bacterium]|nr:DUF393 domain-containing protein [Candidatus Saccharimonadales bacterium]